MKKKLVDTFKIFMFILSVILLCNVSYAEYIAVSRGNQCPSDAGIYSINSDGTENWFFKKCYIQKVIIEQSGTILAIVAGPYGGESDGIYAINTDGTQKWFKQIGYLFEIVASSKNSNNSKVVWDIHNDGKKGVPEAIDALESATNIKSNK